MTARFLFLAALLTLAPAPTALAHGVYIFAWPEGERLCSDSYFSGHSKVRGGRVSLLDAAGQTLESGLTADDGSFCFIRPDRSQDLTFVVEAGQGHRAEFKLRAEDWPLPASTSPADPPLAKTAPAKNKAPTEPGAREIIGGLGWLAGIFGLAAWLAARRRGCS
ncbi:MAG: hypothetical protein LBP55_10415 [Candidatus Adiutrix sp.]|jgi:nickel transport protein|nr:hypothetical protein [Candidatus Adiutrix sp.]